MAKKNHFGIGFSDIFTRHDSVRHRPYGQRRNVSRGGASELFTHADEPELASTGQSWKMVPIKIVAVIGVALIAMRLFNLQIIEGSLFRVRADANRLISRTIHAPRGIIYDRNNKPLVENTPAFVKIGTNSATLISYDEALSQEVQSQVDPSIEIQAVRRYPSGEVFAHILGYTSEVTAEELNERQLKKQYKLGDRIGRSGLEQSYESYLKGQGGASLLEVDAAGKIVRELGRKEPKEGQRLTLTIDSDLQKVAYEELKAAVTKLGLTNGVVIAQNPKTGEILSLVSLPSYDNNLFSRKISQEEYVTVLANKERPLFNRAIAGTYPPGSIYKIVTSTAGFLSKKITRDTKVEDTGVLRLGPYSFPNWFWLSSGGTDGLITVTQALARSNDIFFYKVGEWVGNDYLAQVAKTLGLGKETGIDIPGEEVGLVPTSAWKAEVIKEPWYPGDTYHMAIGQGYNLATPIQMNELSAFVANNGKVFTPRLVNEIVGQDGKVIKRFKPQIKVEGILPDGDVALIREGMKMACEDKSAQGGLRGTGWPFFDFGISRYAQLEGATQSAMMKQRMSVGCKTGTAEFGDPKKRTHAWFTVFAPYDDPEIILTVLIEAGGEGSNVAAPVAKNILEWYFSRK